MWTRIRWTWEEPQETIRDADAPWYGAEDGATGVTDRGWRWAVDGFRVHVTGPEGTSRSYEWQQERAS